MTDLTQPPANEPDARTPTGEIKDVQAPKTEPTTPTTEPAKTSDQVTTTTEAKLAADAKPDAKSLLNKDEKSPATGAPEKYEPFKVPEGFTLDETASTEAQAVFKELGLSQDAGQKLIDMYAKQVQAQAQQPFKDYTALREQWQGQVKADPEIGGKLNVVKETVSRALDSLGDAKLAAEFRQGMDLTGAGDHPAFIKTFYKLAQMVTEGRGVTGKGPSALGQKAPGSAPPDAAHALYPNLA